jgi:hypothetical protein
MEKQTGRVADERGEIAYGLRAVLDATTREAIREANLGFLALVAGTPGTRSPAAYGLDAAATAAVALLDPFARRAVAGLPYTLFNMRFEDGEFWAGVVRDSARPGSASLSEAATFARTVVFLAWHLAQGDELAPAMVLGMNPAAAATWRDLPLSALDYAATRGLPVLEARFGRHPRFWPKLVAAGRAGSRGRGLDLRDLGLQLLAAQGIAAGSAAAAGGG